MLTSGSGSRREVLGHPGLPQSLAARRPRRRSRRRGRGGLRTWRRLPLCGFQVFRRELESLTVESEKELFEAYRDEMITLDHLIRFIQDESTRDFIIGFICMQFSLGMRMYQKTKPVDLTVRMKPRQTLYEFGQRMMLSATRVCPRSKVARGTRHKEGGGDANLHQFGISFQAAQPRRICSLCTLLTVCFWQRKSLTTREKEGNAKRPAGQVQ